MTCRLHDCAPQESSVRTAVTFATHSPVHRDTNGALPTDGGGAILLKSKEAASLLGISERKLWTMTNCGEIPSVRLGKSVRYRRQTLEAFVADAEVPAIGA